LDNFEPFSTTTILKKRTSPELTKRGKLHHLEDRLKNSLRADLVDLLHAKLAEERLDGRMDKGTDVADGLGITLSLQQRVHIGNNSLEDLLVGLRVSKNIEEALDRIGAVAKHADAEFDLASLLGNGTEEELLAVLGEKIVDTLLLSGLRPLTVGGASAPFGPDVLILGGKRADNTALDFADILLRIRADSRHGNLGQRSILGPENDTSIDGTDAALADKERVDIDLLDERVVGSEVTKGNKERLELLHVDWALTTDTLKSLVDLSLRDAGASKGAREGRKHESTILVDFHKLATSAEHNNRAKLRIAVGAKKNLVALLDLKHGLDADTKEVLLPLIGVETLDVALDGSEGSSNASSITNVEDNTTHIRLMSDGLTVQLDNDRIADLGSSSDSILSSLGRDGLRDRNATEGKDLLALSFTENSAASLANLIHDLVHLLDGSADLTSALKDRICLLVELLKVMVITIEGREARSSFISKHEHRHTATTKKAASTLAIITTKEDTEKSLLGVVLSEGLKVCSNSGGWAHGERANEHEDTIDVLKATDLVKALLIVVRRSTTSDIERVRHGPVTRHLRVKALKNLTRDLSKLTATHGNSIRSNHTWATSMADNGHVRATRDGSVADNLGKLEEFEHGVHTDDTSAIESSVNDVIRASERASVRDGSLGGSRSATSLKKKDGLLARYTTSSIDESTSVADGFHIDHDGTHIVIMKVVLEKITPVDINHRTDTGKEAKPTPC